MTPLSIKSINETSPYKVWSEGNDYLFLTTQGILYGISFTEEFEIAGVISYQLSLARLNDIHGKHDPKIKGVVKSIVSEFFNSNHDILLYICDTSDGKEAFRNRLFLQWIDDEDFHKRFVLRTAQAMVEGQGFYTAIIVEKDHPLLEAILLDFDKSAEALSK